MTEDSRQPFRWPVCEIQNVSISFWFHVKTSGDKGAKPGSSLFLISLFLSLSVKTSLFPFKEKIYNYYIIELIKKRADIHRLFFY